MIISHTHKFILIKSMKTAGTSLEAALSTCCSGEDVVTPLNDFRFNRDEKGNWIHCSMNADDYRDIGQHVDAATIVSRVPDHVWNEYFKFSIARNPWDRLVSMFFWEARNRPELQPQKRFYHRLGIRYDHLRQVRELFSQFVRGDWETNDQFYVSDRELCVDFVIRYENLASDFTEVCKRIGLPEMAVPQLKTGFRSKQYHYSRYYDDESTAIVTERHANDIRLLGYRYEIK